MTTAYPRSLATRTRGMAVYNTLRGGGSLSQEDGAWIDSHRNPGPETRLEAARRLAHAPPREDDPDALPGIRVADVHLEAAGLVVRDCGPGGANGGQCVDDEGRPGRYFVLTLRGLFPGRILANPDGGSPYYASPVAALAAAYVIDQKQRAGEAV